MTRVFSLNSLPNRRDNLELMLPNIIGQADIIYVNLIGWNTDYPAILQYRNIHITHLETGGSETRFMHYNKHPNSYYFTIDDDILYPKDYSDVLVSKMEIYGNRVVCCVHGSIPDLSRKEDYWTGRKLFAFQRPLQKDNQVLVPGVGTACFNTATTKMDIADFVTPDMSDAYTSVFLYNQKIPVVCVERKAGWLYPLKEYGTHIWGNHPKEEIDRLYRKTFGL